MWPIGSAPDVDGCATAATDPPQDRHRVVAGHRTGDDGPAVGGAPGVRPQLAPADRHAVGVDRHGARPLAGARHRHHGRRVDDAGCQGPAGRMPQITSHHWAASWVAPPSGPSSVGTDVVLVPGDGAGQRDQSDLGPAGAEVDGQDPGVLPPASGRRGHRASGVVAPGGTAQASAGMACWASIMSAITIRMNSSASSVSPAGHPAVDGARLRNVSGMLVGVGHGIGQVGGEGRGHTRFGLGTGDGHVQRVGVLLPVEAANPVPA